MSTRRDVLIYGGAIALSLGVHVGLVGGLGAVARRAPPERARVIEMAVVRPEPPPPPAPPPVEPPPPAPKPVEKREVKRRPPPPSEAPPPPPPDVPPPPSDATPSADPPKPVFGVSMSSTVGPGQSGFSVRVGNTLMKEPERERTAPQDVKGYAPPAQRYVPVNQVSRMPKPKGECKGAYPAEAKALRIEGEVKLDIEILADGSVGEIRVLKRLGYGLDETAVQALRKCRFEPARVGDEAVATRVPYTYIFILED